jgi:hypothetical protein
MTYNLNNKLGKYICIHCKEEFDEVPKEKINECRYGIQHSIVSKNKLTKIIEKR